MGARGRGTEPRGAWRVAGQGRWRRPLVMGLALALIALVAQFSLDGALGVPVARAFTSQAGGVGRAMLAAPSAEETPTDTPTATVTPTEAPTVTPTPSPTPTPLPPTLTLVSPASGTGPVGAHVTLQGSRWGSGTVQVGVASTSTNCPTPGTWLATLGAPSAMGGSFTLTALWPLSLGVPGTTYAVCALGGAGSTSVAYQVLAAAPPILSLSAASVQVGLPVTIHGANFYGVTSVTLTVSTTSGSRVLTSLAPFGDGTFGYPYITGLGDAGTVTISAASAAEGSAPPALQASAVLSVLALGTPTATVLTTATAVLGGQGGEAPGGGASAPLPFWLPLLLGVVALLLAVVALLLIALRRRPGGAPVGGLSQVGMSAVAGRLPAGGPRVAPGTGPLSDGAGDGTAWQEMDAWVPGDEGPGPDWHPRPMGGTRARMPAVEPEDTGWPSDAAPYMSGYQYTPPLAYTAPGLPAERWSGDQPDELRAGGATTRAAEMSPPLPPVGAGEDGQDQDAAATNPEGMTLAEGEGTVDGGADEMHALNGAAGTERGAEGMSDGKMPDAEAPEMGTLEALDDAPGRLSEDAGAAEGDGSVTE